MEILFTFNSTNSAIQAEQALLAAGLDVLVMPLPGSIRAGCGLCLRLPPAQMETACGVLCGQHVEMGPLYRREVAGGHSQYFLVEDAG